MGKRECSAPAGPEVSGSGSADSGSDQDVLCASTNGAKRW